MVICILVRAAALQHSKQPVLQDSEELVQVLPQVLPCAQLKNILSLSEERDNNSQQVEGRYLSLTFITT